MGLFSFTQEIAMDLGTANTIILNNGNIVVDEPSVVALDRRTDKMIAVGERAKMMYEKENPNIRTVRPLRDGVIADFNACEQMMRGLIKKVNIGNRFFTPSLRMVIGVPSGSTEVELRAVRDSAEHAGGRDVYLIFEPMAAAIGIGIDVEAPEGNMIVDIGGGSTEIAVISLGGIVSNNSIRTMVVRNMVLDALNYEAQVKAIAKKHQEDKDLHGSAEYLSGFKKTDKLLPVITITLYWNSGKWDAPRNLHDMLNVTDEEILQYVPNYNLNLLVPDEIEDFEGFQSDLGVVLRMFQCTNDKSKLKKLIDGEVELIIGKEAATLLSECLSMKIDVSQAPSFSASTRMERNL